MSYSVGIELTSTAIRLVQVSRRRGVLSVLGTHTIALGHDGLPVDADAIRALLSSAIGEAGFKARTNIVVSLPAEKVFFHSLTTDLDTRKDIRSLLRFELEDDFPISFDDLVVDICGHHTPNQDRQIYLVAAAARREIDSWGRAIEASRQKSCILSAAVCALRTLACLAGPYEDAAIRVLVYADDARMILGLLQDGGLVCARQRHCTGGADAIAATLAREIELTLRTTLRNHRGLPVKILLSGPDGLVRELLERLPQATGYDLQRLPVSSIVRAAEMPQFDGEFAIALGLALLGLNPAERQLNFLDADSTRVARATRSRTKRAALVSVALLATIFGLLTLRIVQELSRLTTEHTRLNREIRAVFLGAFPNERRIVNELAQMTDHVNSLKKQRDTLAAAVGEPIRALWALQVISEKLASDGRIRISSFTVADGTIHIAGTGDSFESIELFLAGLRQVPQFGSIELEDMASSRGSDRPGFRLLISVRAG